MLTCTKPHYRAEGGTMSVDTAPLMSDRDVPVFSYVRLDPYLVR